MRAIEFWDNLQNYLNTKYMADKKTKKNHRKQFTIACHLQISFRIKRIQSKKIHGSKPFTIN